METKWVRPFILSAGGILQAAALIRFLIAAGDVQALSLPEPVLGIPIRFVVLAVGGFELIVAFICLFGKRAGLQIGWLAWLATNFVVYRIGLFLMHIHPQATCIGSLTDPLYLSRGVTGYLMEFIPFYLVLGSYAACGWLWFSKEGRAARLIATQRRIASRDAAAGLLKMFCPSCGGHIKFSSQNLSQKISCPHCQNETTLRKPDLLKMSCFFCKEHIEFPVHALGQKIPCPHCKMEITLKEPA
jgi:hypothetical protein